MSVCGEWWMELKEENGQRRVVGFPHWEAGHFPLRSRTVSVDVWVQSRAVPLELWVGAVEENDYEGA